MPKRKQMVGRHEWQRAGITRDPATLEKLHEVWQCKRCGEYANAPEGEAPSSGRCSHEHRMMLMWPGPQARTPHE